MGATVCSGDVDVNEFFRIREPVTTIVSSSAAAAISLSSMVAIAPGTSSISSSCANADAPAPNASTDALVARIPRRSADSDFTLFIIFVCPMLPKTWSGTDRPPKTRRQSHLIFAAISTATQFAHPGIAQILPSQNCHVKHSIVY